MTASVGPCLALGAFALALMASPVCATAVEPDPVPLAIPVDAQDETQPDPAAAQLEPIVVTASKRAEIRRDVAGSVEAIAGESLEAMHAQGLEDYLRLVPGVTYADQGSDGSVPIIRGIATQIGFGITAQTTGVYLDDMPFTDLFVPLSLPDLHPFDLERVEVLKGPQGTLFGSGALAGAVRYIVLKPRHELWEGKLLHTVARTDGSADLSRVTAAAINAPLGRALALRAAGTVRDAPGLYDMAASDGSGNTLRDDADADGVEQTMGRVLASWRPSDALHVSAFYVEQQSLHEDGGYADQPLAPRADGLPFPSPRKYGFSGANLLATYDFDWGQLLSSTNRMTKDNDILTHAEWFFGLEQQNDSQWYDKITSQVRGFTQELRLGSPQDDGFNGWTWLAGASYLRYDNDFMQYEPMPGPQDAPPPESAADLSEQERAGAFLFLAIDSAATEEAVFGEVSRGLGDRWQLTVGARRYRTRMVADSVFSGAQVVALVQKTEERAHFEPESTGLNPKLAVRYLHNEHVQAYALAAKGFQFGGVQLNPASPVLVQSAEQAGYAFGPYDSSSLWNYEVGLRTEWLDRRLRFDVGVFHLDWKDLQLTVRAPITGTNASFNVIANVGRAHSDGVETALEILPFRGARWTSSAAWIDAATDVPFDEGNEAGAVPAGTRLPGTPRFQWTNVASYDWGPGALPGWSLASALTHVHLGESPDAIRPTGSVGGYDTLDARLTLARTAGRFMPEISVGLNNLTDVRGVTYHGRMAPATVGEARDFYHFVDPRTAVLTVAMRY